MAINFTEENFHLLPFLLMLVRPLPVFFFLIFSHLFFFPHLMSHICPRKNVFTGTCINVLAVHDVQWQFRALIDWFKQLLISGWHLGIAIAFLTPSWIKSYKNCKVRVPLPNETPTYSCTRALPLNHFDWFSIMYM